MPALKCTAVKCVYNKEQLCSKGDIQVQGDHAKSMDETACGSFRERSESDYSNASGCGCHTIEVGCTACTCKYNEDKYCHAGAIDITGEQASTSRETCGSTFECE